MSVKHKITAKSEHGLNKKLAQIRTYETLEPKCLIPEKQENWDFETNKVSPTATTT